VKDERFGRFRALAMAVLALVLSLGIGGGLAISAPGKAQPGPDGALPSAAAAGPGAAAAPPAGPVAPLPRRLPLEPGISVGEGAAIGNLQIYPIYSQQQQSIGEFTTLPLALRAGTAVVREHEGGAEVGSVEIQNKGRLPIVVLGGTIIKGGKQDRQIGQDFIIAAYQRVPVDAFCVEPHRWEPVRGGVATGGSFSASGILATREVQVAGQFKGNQGEVWSEVAKVNAAAGKQPDSGTLMATVDDQELVRKRKELARQAKSLLLDRPERDDVVGLAYAIDGQVRAVRWFAHRDLLRQFGDSLLETAAMEAVNAEITATRPPAPASAATLAPSRVAEFIAARKQIQRSERKATQGANENEYRFSDQGYSSQTRLKASPKAPAKAVMDAYY
jgi:hypothetical protein